MFKCDQWLDFDTGDTKVDRVLSAQSEVRSYMELITYITVEHHLWLSVFMRPMRNNFSRIQRISCLHGLIYLTMVICTMIIKMEDTQTIMKEVVIGPFRFSKENFETALIAVTLSSIVIWLVSFFFKNAESDSSNKYDTPLLRAYRAANRKLNFDSSYLGRYFVPPAEETIHHQFFFLPYFTVYLAWIILLMAVAVASYLLIVFSDDWKLIRSETWMTAIFTAVLCSCMIIEVMKV